MNKRYQVFVSSTFRDLHEERSHVIQALLELDCIPCGMELFPAADEDQWSYIQGIIDDCDYYVYVVVLAGKYGSISPVTGKSYTQMEYEYALEKGKPTIAFLYKDLSKLHVERFETDATKRGLLEQFRAEVETKLCKHWESPDQLHGVVLQSMIHLMKRRPAVGWVRADQVTDESAAREIVRLHHRIEELEAELKNSGLDTEELAQGRERVDIRFSYSEYQDSEEDDAESHWKGKTTTLDTSWERIFMILAPKILRPVSENTVRTAMNDVLYDRRPSWKSWHIEKLCIIEEYFQTVKAQARALGLVEVTESDDPTIERLWHLTPKGDSYNIQAKVIKKRDRQ